MHADCLPHQVLEAIYGDDLQHDEGESTNATELAAHVAALEVIATEAATTSAVMSGAAMTGAVRVAFSVKLDGGGGGGSGSGGGGDDDISLPPEEVRLHISLPSGYPHRKVMPRFTISHHMLRDQVSSLIAC